MNRRVGPATNVADEDAPASAHESVRAGDGVDANMTDPALTTSPRKRQRVVDSTNVGANESLLKRMGGPSAAKAGLNKDQAEINRIIYEASKGSKFFENERRNDERITRKVEAMLLRMEERLTAVPEGSPEWKAVERRIDALAAKCEEKRDLSRFIIHCDLDMFYAAVELKRDPTLKGKAFGVGKGVLVTASYEARAFGVRSGMASHIAYALCPNLVTVPNNMSAYVEASGQVMAIFRRFDSNLLQASLDEAYLDLTDYCRLENADVDDVVAELRAQVRNETGLTVSVGVAPNTMLAKIGSDKNKPDGQFRLEASVDACKGFMASLPIRKVPGVGRVTERTLQALGVESCGDIWTYRVRIALVLGDTSLEWLVRYHLGIASSRVEPSKREERKSVGREHTFKPTTDPQQLLELLRESADRVAEDLERLDFVGKKVTLTFKLDNFQRFTRDQTQHGHVSKAEEIFRVTRSLLEHELKVTPGLSLRLIGARVSTLKDIRKPEDGGPLKRLWTKSDVSPRKRRIRRDPVDPDTVRDDAGHNSDIEGELNGHGEEDEESRQLRLAIAASLETARLEQSADHPKDDLEALNSFSESMVGEDSAGQAELSGEPEGVAMPRTPSWSLSPPPERTANRFAQELHRSTPEVMRPSPRKRLASPTVDDLEAAMGPVEPVGQANGKNLGKWLHQNSDSEKSTPSAGVEKIICPLCTQEIPVRFGSTLSGRNAQLNAHIDQCLANGGNRGDSNAPQSPAARPSLPLPPPPHPSGVSTSARKSPVPAMAESAHAGRSKKKNTATATTTTTKGATLHTFFGQRRP
ncbi:unnamed protein product [Parajaminaea phylloscopi]